LSAIKVLKEGAYPYLYLTDKMFLQTCRFDAYMASGHGGQKRNRTYSAVRLTHIATGLSVIAEESRSQGENKIKAVKRLRMAIALHIRKQRSDYSFTIPDEIKIYVQQESPLHINIKNPLYPLLCATVLDAMYLTQGKIGDASRLLNASTGRMNRLLSNNRDLFQAANELRIHFNLKPLHSI
jgi:hypothetical protein